MKITKLSSREFARAIGRAKKATSAGPVFITDRGKPTHVLLSIDTYRRLRGERGKSPLHALIPSEASQAIDFERPKFGWVSGPLELD